MADDAHVLLCTCRDMGELQMLRAALEARGVPVWIEGAAVHGVLGMIHGAALAPRVMVPPAWRSTAREIAADIVGPFDDDDDAPAPTGGNTSLPFRTEGPELDADPNDPDEEEDDDDAIEVAAPKPLRFAIPLMLVVLGLPWGFGHIYARRPVHGLLLLLLTAAAAAALFGGVRHAGMMLAAIGLADLVGSLFHIARYNRALAPG